MDAMRVKLFGVAVDSLNYEQTLARIETLIDRGEPVQHVVLNAAKVVAMADDPALRAIISECPIVNADGMSVVLASRLLSAGVPERVTGADLFGDVLGMCARRDWPVYLLGATQDVVEEVRRLAQDRVPGLRVVGARNGYFTRDDDSSIARDIRESGAVVLFVGMPSPAKEFWLAEHLAATGASFGMGVGGTFDIWAGKTHRAPKWMQRAGLEWAYRFGQEPRRMWRRYLVGNARFAWLLVKEAVRVHTG